MQKGFGGRVGNGRQGSDTAVCFEIGYGGRFGCFWGGRNGGGHLHEEEEKKKSSRKILMQAEQRYGHFVEQTAMYG